MMVFPSLLKGRQDNAPRSRGTAWGARKGRGGDWEQSNGKRPANELKTMRSDVIRENRIADLFLGATIVPGAIAGVVYAARPEKADSRLKSWILTPAALGGRGVSGGFLLEGSF